MKVALQALNSILETVVKVKTIAPCPLLSLFKYSESKLATMNVDQRSTC